MGSRAAKVEERVCSTATVRPEADQSSNSASNALEQELAINRTRTLIGQNDDSAVRRPSGLPTQTRDAVPRCTT